VYSPVHRESYRPDIDGLRAIAVMSVVIHHISQPIMPGGFVGVDIFFVISGFLITSQIYKEAIDGSFSIRQFYKRRINRIIPALLTVVCISYIAGFFILSPADLSRLSASAFYSMIGVSNVYFWREYGNYFGGDTSVVPLLHTWSLGVEEQFYAIWPAAILLLIRLPRRYVLASLAALTLCAAVFSEYSLGIVASASYYLLPMRFFELMIGGVLAVGMTKNTVGLRAYRAAAGTAGLVLIAYSLFALDASAPFPGVNALPACLGTAMLIWSGAERNTISRLVLSNRPMVFLGLISYSLYLWHWPIIAYLNYLDVGTVLAKTGSGLAAALLLSWLSWKYIEVPFRRSGATLQFSSVFVRRFAIPAAGLLSLGAATIFSGGFPQRFDPLVASLEQMALQQSHQLRKGCHVPTAAYQTPPNDACRLGADKPHIDGILIGDSFANHFTGMLDVLAKADGITIMDYTMDACPPILNYTSAKSASYGEKCISRNRFAYSLVEKNRYSFVILAGQWPTGAEVHNAMQSSIERILGTGAKVVVILSNQEIKNAAACPIKKLMFKMPASCDGQRNDIPHYWTSIRARFPQLIFIDPNEAICHGGTCNPVIEKTLLYRDTVHLNDVGSRMIGRILREKSTSLVRPAAFGERERRLNVPSPLSEHADENGVKGLVRPE
jgi:peptidoglycan/LPS O-acetylase OafA/YrhL